MKQLFLYFILAIVIFSSAVSSLAQSSSSSAPKIGVDESNVIFPGCRLSKLKDPNEPKTPIIENKGQLEGIKEKEDELKKEYIKGCMQEIIRFIIVIASLAAILKIAASGVQLMFNDKEGTKARSTITNLVIGLFLLIVGWNMIPILNASFNNVNFLNLPRVNYCDIKSACVSERTLKLQRFQGCTQRYEEIMDDKKYEANNDLKLGLATCIVQYCQVAKDFDEIENDSCEDDFKPKGYPKDPKVVVRRIDELNEEGKKLRAAKGVDNTPSSDLEAEMIRLIKADKIKQIDGKPDIIIKQVQEKKLTKALMKTLTSLAKAPGVDSIKIWEPWRSEPSPPFHKSGKAVDLKSVTMGGKEFTADDAFAGKTGADFEKIAEILYTFKTVRQIIMAGPIVDQLFKNPHFNAAPRKGTIEKIRIATTPGLEDKTARHEDHWHIDVFE